MYVGRDRIALHWTEQSTICLRSTLIIQLLILRGNAGFGRLSSPGFPPTSALPGYGAMQRSDKNKVRTSMVGLRDDEISYASVSRRRLGGGS